VENKGRSGRKKGKLKNSTFIAAHRCSEKENEKRQEEREVKVQTVKKAQQGEEEMHAYGPSLMKFRKACGRDLMTAPKKKSGRKTGGPGQWGDRNAELSVCLGEKRLGQTKEKGGKAGRRRPTDPSDKKRETGRPRKITRKRSSMESRCIFRSMSGGLQGKQKRLTRDT